MHVKMILGGENKNVAVVVVTRVRTTIHINFVIGKIDIGYKHNK